MSPIARTTQHEERALARAGFARVAGVDEAGCGCLAGPVVAAAVILPERVRNKWMRDSKQLSAERRIAVAEVIKSIAIAWAIGEASVQEIDALNIRRAGALAMRRAIEGLAIPPDYVLTDAFFVEGLSMPCKNMIKGDARVKSIAAASILAKTHRDALCVELDAAFPGYGFALHKGYGTKAHQEALARLGPSPAHRMSYAPVRAAAGTV